MDIQQTLARLGLDALTPMQEAARRAWTDGRDLVLLSPTGTGKTLAYLLPLAAELDAGRPEVQAVVVTPTRELAQQTAEVYRTLRTPAAALCLHGGRPTMEEHRRLREVRPALVIATPGRLCDHLRKQNFSPAAVRTLVIDEFDKCLELGFRDELEELTAALQGVRRRVLLSATAPPPPSAWTSSARARTTGGCNCAGCSPRSGTSSKPCCGCSVCRAPAPRSSSSTTARASSASPASCATGGSPAPPSTAGWSRTSASAPSTASATARPRRSSAPTSPPADWT